MKTDDYIPNHSGSVQYTLIKSNEEIPSHSGGSSEKSTEISIQAKKMILINFWTGFFSELEQVDSESYRKCITYSDAAFDDLVQYQQSLDDEKHF